MTNSLISVIVPIYNVEPFLPRCIDSIINQTYRDLEIILVDDGSPDNCGTICDDYAKKDSRIIVIHQKNAGQGAARNAGLSIARGTYIGFVDSDDWIAPSMYETLADNLIKEKADIAVCGRYLEYESGEAVSAFCFQGVRVFDSHEASRRFLLSEGIDAAVWDKLYTKKLWCYTRFPSEYVSEDVPIISQMLVRADRVVHCGVPLYYYLQRGGSSSHSAFNAKSAGLYYYSKEANVLLTRQFPELNDEGNYYYFKGLLVYTYLYTKSGTKNATGEEALQELQRNIYSICKNKHLKCKYKVFAISSCLGLRKLMVRISDYFKINDKRRGNNA